MEMFHFCTGMFISKMCSPLAEKKTCKTRMKRWWLTTSSTVGYFCFSLLPPSLCTQWEQHKVLCFLAPLCVPRVSTGTSIKYMIRKKYFRFFMASFRLGPVVNQQSSNHFLGRSVYSSSSTVSSCCIGVCFSVLPLHRSTVASDQSLGLGKGGGVPWVLTVLHIHFVVLNGWAPQ